MGGCTGEHQLPKRQMGAPLQPVEAVASPLTDVRCSIPQVGPIFDQVLVIDADAFVFPRVVARSVETLDPLVPTW